MGEAAAAFATTVAVRIAEKARRLIHALFDTYRPELHYMRGPGPKWQEKYGQTPAMTGLRAIDVSTFWKAGG